MLLAHCVSSETSGEPVTGDDVEDEPAVTSLREGFEDTDIGALPRGYSGAGYGRRTLGVTDMMAARGSRSLRIEVEADQGAVVGMLVRGNLGELSVAHFGRVFLRIEGPGVEQFVHFDAFEGEGPWEAHSNSVRWASTGTGVGQDRNNWSWIYNVQPTQGNEFGSEGPRSAHPRVDDWMCLEWRFDSTTQEAEFWFDAQAIDYLSLPGADGRRTEIPAFRRLGVGFQKFQQTDGFVVWIDEVAYDIARIGCE